MSFLLKDPEALLDYAVDWGAEYLSGDALLDSSCDCAVEHAILSAAEVGALGIGPIEIQVRQIGTLALSRPATLLINT